MWGGGVEGGVSVCVCGGGGGRAAACQYCWSYCVTGAVHLKKQQISPHDDAKCRWP